MEKLGQKKAHYANKKWSNIIAGIALAIMELAFIPVIIARSQDTSTLIVMLLIMGVFTFYPISLIKNAKNYAELYENGFVFTKGKKKFTIFWDEIKSTRWTINKYKRKFVTHTDVYITIEKTNGETIHLNNQQFQFLPELGNEIEQAIANLRIPDLISRLQVGETVEMCKLALTASGIEAKQSFLPWEQVNRAVLSDNKDQLFILKKGNPPEVWNKIDYYNEPNLTLLHTFINTYAMNFPSSYTPNNDPVLHYTFHQP